MSTWWPDWRGETVVIAASGPSQRREDIEFASARAKVMAINNTWQIAPGADVLYFCDRSWWLCENPGYGQHALREFLGLLVTANSQIPEAHHAPIIPVIEALYTDPRFGGGGNSAFQAMNIAALWGADRILLTGVDCMRPGEHHHGPHSTNNAPGTTPIANARETTVQMWLKAFGEVAPQLAARGVEVINCTRETALECFPRSRLEDVL